MNARTWILRSAAHVAGLERFIRANWQSAADAGRALMVEIRPEDSRRTREQNARYWAILHAIEESAWVDGREYPAEAWHEWFKRKFLGTVDLPDGGTIGQSTARLTVAQMSDYIDRVEAYAVQELGVEL